MGASPNVPVVVVVGVGDGKVDIGRPILIITGGVLTIELLNESVAVAEIV